MNNTRREIHYTIAWIAPSLKKSLQLKLYSTIGMVLLMTSTNYQVTTTHIHGDVWIITMLLIVSLPAGTKDLVSAAVTVANLTSPLNHIRIGLLVGVGGGIPRLDLGRGIRHGDIVISQP